MPRLVLMTSTRHIEPCSLTLMCLQGIECKFLEAWHQKLHTNTTSEDITVCEAYIAFLESGDPGTYSRVLWEHGGISREAMANKWDRKIPG